MEDNYRVALAKSNGVVIGQAFYLRDDINSDTFTWVLQLVVHSDYRIAGIGSMLLHFIWGFSDDLAWELATANPFTVKTLEGTTFRHVHPEEIKKHEDLVREICSRIPYISQLIIDGSRSIADTNFFVDAEGMDEELLMKKFGDSWVLGSLPSGHEWVAFTFRDQNFDSDFIEELQNLISFSESRLKDAYGRMDMENHPWARHSSEEMMSVERICGSFEGLNILDAGCGRGRHSLEIARSNPTAHIHGIDFSEANIVSADSKKGDLKNIDFEVSDLRSYRSDSQYDLILCLYDVIGSVPDHSDNLAILKNLHSCCKPGGFIVISVMNMELTVHAAIPSHIGNVSANPRMLSDLPPSDVMHRSGDVFDPRYYLIDSESGLVYRKEQFRDDSSLPAEYVIRDRRYTADEIKGLVSDSGFDIVCCRYVRAGRWDEPLGATDSKAKEILLVGRRVDRSRASHRSRVEGAKPGMAPLSSDRSRRQVGGQCLDAVDDPVDPLVG